MAINPNISLAIQPAQVRSPLESFQRAVSIRDMLQGIAEEPQRRKLQQLQMRTAELDVQGAELQAAKAAKDARMETARQAAFSQNRTWDEEKGWQVNVPGAVKMLGRDYPELAMEIQGKEAQIQREAAQQSINDWTQRATFLKQLGESFGEDLAANEQMYSQLTPQQLDYLNLPKRPTPEAIEMLKKTAERMRTEAERKAIAERKKIEQGLTAPTEKGYAPGTLIITKDAEGNEISRETVPEKESDTARKSRLVEEAYAQLKLKGKSRDAMTAAERVAAARWNESLTPEKKSDQDKLMELFRSKDPKDRELFDILSRNFERGPTVANRISMIGQANTAANDEQRQDRKPAAYNRVRQRFLPQFPDFPPYEKGAVIQPEVPTPKAAKPEIKASGLKPGDIIKGDETTDGQDYVFEGYDEQGRARGKPVTKPKK